MKWELHYFSINCSPQCLFIYTVALHCVHTRKKPAHTYTRMKNDRDYLSFCTQLKFSPCKPHAECLIQNRIHHCTMAFAACEPVGLSRESIILYSYVAANQACRPALYKNTNPAGPTTSPPLCICLILHSCYLSGEPMIAVAWDWLI